MIWPVYLLLSSTIVLAQTGASASADDLSQNASIGSELSVYASQFTECDTNEMFGGVPSDKLSLCGNDPNRLEVLEHHESGALRFISKLSLDLDGGWKACNNPGPTDQCPTTYVYEKWKIGTEENRLENWQQAFVSSDAVPYIVIPFVRFAGNELFEDTQFRDLTNVSIGDVGVVIQNDLVIPVLVADGGPHNKIGEGSIALFEKLSQSRCLSWGGAKGQFCEQVLNESLVGSVETYIFPSSEIDGLTADNTNELVAEKALKLYAEMILNSPMPKSE